MAAKCEFRFGQLLDHIKFGRNDKAKSMLNEELAQKFDGFGTLLHRAAYYDNVEIVQRLIELGADVDYSGAGGKTPLMVAVKGERLATVKVLLDTDADIDIADAHKQNALQMVCRADYIDTRIIEALLHKVETQTSDNKIFIVLRLRYYAPLDAIILGKLHIIKCLLQFKSEYLREEKKIPLDRAITFICLELDDNAKSLNNDHCQIEDKYLIHGCVYLSTEDEQVGDLFFRELQTHLLECGIMSSINRDFGYSTVYDLNKSSFVDFSNNANALIAHLAVLEKLGTSIIKTAKCYSAGWLDGQLINVEKYHELCSPMLDTVMFGSSTLFDLLTNYHKMRIYVRNETFTSVIGNVCSKHQLRELFPYYYKTLMIRASKAEQIVKLEDAAIIVISKIFNSNYNRCYHLARQVVGYLNKLELERLCLCGEMVGYLSKQEIDRLCIVCD